MTRDVSPRETWVAVALACLWALIFRAGPLDTPYFWDEADVYAQGARWLAEHGMNATPGVFPDDWSRGHPPLFYLLVGIVFRIAGPGPAAGHALIVPFTALALFATYMLGRLRSGRVAGLAGALLLGTSPLFLSSGAFVLPEMPLTALTALALLFAETRRYLAAAVVGVALVWIKETGICTPLAIAGGIALVALREKKPREYTRTFLISTIPIAGLALFFLWQRATAGYFVFPHHQNLFAERPFTAANVFTVFPSIFYWHGRGIATLAAVVVLGIAATRRSVSRLVTLDATSLAFLLLVLGNAIFFSKMFWLERYALPAHPGVCVLIGCVLANAADAARGFRVPSLLPVAIAAGVGLFFLRASGTTNAPEHTFAFVDVVRSHQEAFAQLRDARGAHVLTTWPLTTELREPWLGYVREPVNAVHPDNLSSHPNFRPNIVLVDTSSERADELRSIAHRETLTLRARTSTPNAPPIEIWATTTTTNAPF